MGLFAEDDSASTHMLNLLSGLFFLSMLFVIVAMHTEPSGNSITECEFATENVHVVVF